MALPGESFLAAAYKLILKRDVDADGLFHHMERLSRGIGKEAVLVDLMNSREAQTLLSSNDQSISGLRAMLSQELEQLRKKQKRGLFGRWAGGHRDDKKVNAIEFRLEMTLSSMLDRMKQNLAREIEHYCQHRIDITDITPPGSGSSDRSMSTHVEVPLRVRVNERTHQHDLKSGSFSENTSLPSEARRLLENKNLFHIYIQDNMQIPVNLPEMVIRNIESLKDVYPNYDHTLHSGESLREFIRKNYDNEVLSAFDILKPHAYKADLGRYCLLHTLGGVYSDISNRFLRPIYLNDDHVLAAFSDTNGGIGTPWSINNGIIAVKKDSIEMGLMIKRVLENVRSRHYGRSPLSPTGPDLLGRVLAECYNPLQYSIGDMACITRTFSEHITFVFLESSGRLIAVRMKSQGGSSTELGVDFKNNYNELWSSRNVYSGISG